MSRRTIIDLVEDSVKSIRNEEGKPYYSYNTWPEEADRLTQLNKEVTSDDIKFPLVFLRLSVREPFDESEKQYSPEIFIYIIGRTKSKYNSKYRHENEMPKLRDIEDDLLKSLNVNNVKYTDFSREEVMYAEFNINEPVNFIELQIPVIINKNCLT
jgi:hypothetical protein